MSLLTLYFGTSGARMVVLSLLAMIQPSGQERHLLPHVVAPPSRQVLLTDAAGSPDRSRAMMSASPRRPFLSDLLPLSGLRRKLPTPVRPSSLLSVAQTHRSKGEHPGSVAKPQLLPL